jgi:sec-independent protein translocase protein TatB
MFGLGFTEIVVIAIIAVLFLGPDKLPSAMVDIAKFFRQVKNSVSSVKNSFEEEMHISDIKKEAMAYKQELLDTGENIKKATDIDSHIADISNDITSDTKENKSSPKEEEITFKKEPKDSLANTSSDTSKKDSPYV